jgi:hypothetical protein
MDSIFMLRVIFAVRDVRVHVLISMLDLHRFMEAHRMVAAIVSDIQVILVMLKSYRSPMAQGYSERLTHLQAWSQVTCLDAP